MHPLAYTLFSAAIASELVLYWGQASSGSQSSLGDYCKQTAGDIYVISFINSFSSSSLSLNVAGACTDTFSSSELLHCPSIGEDIKSCQAAGKKVFVSLGGASGEYGFGSDNDGELCAKNVWNTFGGGTSNERPFDDAIVDGFDLDIENGNSKGYTGFVNELRTYFSQDSSKQYYISAAPQCPYPDASIGDALSNAKFDHIYIQFYNNYCSLSGSQFNWDTWQNYAENTSPNKNVKLYIGLPGSKSAAGSGYVSASDVQSKIGTVQSSANFGGIMLWDASQAFSNEDNGVCYAIAMHSILSGTSASSATSAISSSYSVSSASSSSYSAPSDSSVTDVSASKITSAEATTLAISSFDNYAYKGTLSANQPEATSKAAAVSTPESSPSSDSTTIITQATTMIVGQNYVTITPSSTTATVLTTTSSAPESESSTDGTCTEGQTKCEGPDYTICDHGKWVVLGCAAGTTCQVNDDGNAYCVFAKRQVRHHRHQLSDHFNVISI